MLIINCILMALPVIFLIVSVALAVRAVSHGKSRKRTMLMQLASFAAVFAVCLVCTFVASADTGDTASASAGASGMAYIAAAAARSMMPSNLMVPVPGPPVCGSVTEASVFVIVPPICSYVPPDIYVIAAPAPHAALTAPQNAEREPI